MARKNYTLGMAMEAIAKSLREFGYPDTTATMIREIYDAWLSGKRGTDLPHNIIGMFAERQFEEVADDLKKLPDDRP